MGMYQLDRIVSKIPANGFPGSKNCSDLARNSRRRGGIVDVAAHVVNAVDMNIVV
jgi:hypothetical protein